MRALATAVFVLCGSMLAGETPPAVNDPLAALNVEVAAPDLRNLSANDEQHSLEALLDVTTHPAPKFDVIPVPQPVATFWADSDDRKIDRCKNQLSRDFRTMFRFGANDSAMLDKIMPLRGHFVYVPGEHTPTVRTVVAFCKCKQHGGKGRCVLTSDGKVEWAPEATQLRKDVSDTLKHFNQPIDFTDTYSQAQLEQAVVDLNHEDFDTREQAAAILARGSPTAIKLLLAGSESTEKEVAHRCKGILHLLGRSRIVLIREEFDARAEK